MEFYTSPRHDAQGITAAILNHGESALFTGAKPSGHSYSYELDSIKLFNKHDRFVNGPKAVPVKSVFFIYDYTLCAGIPNSDDGGGKLTLTKLYFSYGSSQKSMISPYQFGYAISAGNPNYSLCSKDRWGNYKPNNTGFTNYEFPYVNQNDTANNTYASSWSLTNITLPSGGIIEARFESNDYAFVQDQPVDEMFILQGLGNSPVFVNDDRLYTGSKSSTAPCLYAYFLRRPGSELSKLSFAQNYLGYNFQPGGKNCMYFNFNVSLTGANNTYEQVKGYANVSDARICVGDTMHGYIKFTPVTPAGSVVNLNPATYTALNVGRYNLPQIVFSGFNENESDLKNVLAGLKIAFGNLTHLGENPIVQMVSSGGGQNVNLNKSYIRLQSVGLRKKGGGQRVKSLTFFDSWNVMAGGNEQPATYGKQYNYTINDPTYGTISSGVASYEPLIGGDENPLRQPAPYIGQSGSNWPPSDPVDLYQETPIGESLFPPAVVGYSLVTVTSIHANQGKSSQGVDQYQFYTARDFPAQVIATSINSISTNHFDFFSQQNLLKATQGYTLIFNDMHGKPKQVEHDVYNPASQTIQPISYQIYNYRANGTKLNNTVKCIAYNGTNMVVQNQQLGVEADVTLDSRQKDEVTNNSTNNFSTNAFIIPFGIFPIPFDIPLAYTWTNKMENEFQSAVVTKVVQQYGILDNVQSYNEGALTTMQNEVYDPNTGQAVVTSTTNEFRDKEYTTNIPAYWVYKGMGPSYNNISYKDTGTITVGLHHVGTFNIINTAPLVAGDELSVFYTDSLGNKQHTIGWVLGTVPSTVTFDTVANYDAPPYRPTGLYYSGDTIFDYYFDWHEALQEDVIVRIHHCTGLNVLPRFPLNTAGWNVGDTLTNVSIEVISSGQTNMLNENVESYTSMDNPINGSTNILNNSLTNLISLNGKTFADSNTVVLHYNIADADTVNPWDIGERGIWRLYTEYAYKTDRNYGGVTARNSGLFNATSMLAAPSGLPTTCYLSPYNYLMPSFSDPNWHASRTVTKYSPYGKEIENIDAVGNYSTAVFGFNQELPVAVAANAKQGDIFTDGFEDYNLLQYTGNIINYRYSFFNYFTSTPLANPFYDTLNLTHASDSISIVSNIAHTGTHSLYMPSVGGSTEWDMGIPVNLNAHNDSGLTNYYNSYFPYSPTAYAYQFTSANEYLPFEFVPGGSYVLSYWIQQVSPVPNITDYPIPGNCAVEFGNGYVLFLGVAVRKKTNIIDGWQQVEATFTAPLAATTAYIALPAGFYIDDMRIFPANANMKSFVYNPYSEKLMATLDENNFATMYEYDQEGNLVRTKKETTKGIMTVSESRSGNPKH